MTLAPPTVPSYGLRPLNGGPYRGRPFAYNVEEYSYTPKLNGWQLLVHIPTSMAFNRKGEPLSIASEFEDALATVHATLDCQAFEWAVFEGLERRHGIGKGALILLDVIPHDPVSYEERSLWVPPAKVPVLQVGQQPEANEVYQLQRFGYSGLEANWLNMQSVNEVWGCQFYEGVVAARNDAPFPLQLRNPDETNASHIKHRWKY